MKKPASPEIYVNTAPDLWRARLARLRNLMLEHGELTEAIKWNFPVYSLGKKNVVSLFYSKSYVGVWFMQGALLKDPEGRLVNASPEKTVAQRQLRFGPEEKVDEELVRGYVEEAVLNQTLGLQLTIAPAAAPKMPDLLSKALAADERMAATYANFPPYKQREFCESIADAKRGDTRQRRLVKVLEHLREGRGLSDKYR